MVRALGLPGQEAPALHRLAHVSASPWAMPAIHCCLRESPTCWRGDTAALVGGWFGHEPGSEQASVVCGLVAALVVTWGINQARRLRTRPKLPSKDCPLPDRMTGLRAVVPALGAERRGFGQLSARSPARQRQAQTRGRLGLFPRGFSLAIWRPL
jgi:hypothetical protein